MKINGLTNVRRADMAGKKYDGENKLQEQIDQICSRLTYIEKNVYKGKDTDLQPNTETKESCGLPEVPPRELEPGIDTVREGLIRSIEKKWVNGTELKYYFFKQGDMKGTGSQYQIVRDAFDEWKNIGIGLSFLEVNSPAEADIRIGFLRGDGAWSYVGRDIWTRPSHERTMNFGWKLFGQDGMDTALHEIGHTLGFHHEQQNPFAGIEWDEDAVYRYFMGPPNNWSRQKTYHNVLKVLDPVSVEGSEWDPDSIMQYSVQAGLIIRPERFRAGLEPEFGLSDIDRERVKLFYPELRPQHEKLNRFEPKMLDLAPSEQLNFSIEPDSTRNYQIQTFGESDTVMVLFENDVGTLEHFATDDDSGWNRNANLNVRLVAGRKYVLRIRLYFSQDSGGAAVMLW